MGAGSDDDGSINGSAELVLSTLLGLDAGTPMLERYANRSKELSAGGGGSTELPVIR